MINQGLPIADSDEPLKHWRQGDFALDAGGFLYANMTEDDNLFDAEEISDNIVGFVIISQTCDIVRRTGGRNFVAVCPLIKVPAGELSDIRKGRRPYFTDVENVDEDLFADLRRIMSVHKDLVQTWERRTGFKNDTTRHHFAAALERKFGQFAFPDDFDKAIKKFRDRVWSRHSKPESEIGKVYRSLVQIRFGAEPGWAAEKRKIKVVAIMEEAGNREVDRDIIGKELDSILNKIEWPDGYEWGKPNFILGTTKDLTAEDVISSQRGDFDFLCY